MHTSRWRWAAILWSNATCKQENVGLNQLCRLKAFCRHMLVLTAFGETRVYHGTVHLCIFKVQPIFCTDFDFQVMQLQKILIMKHIETYKCLSLCTWTGWRRNTKKSQHSKNLHFYATIERHFRRTTTTHPNFKSLTL